MARRAGRRQVEERAVGRRFGALEVPEDRQRVGGQRRSAQVVRVPRPTAGARGRSPRRPRAAGRAAGGGPAGALKLHTSDRLRSSVRGVAVHRVERESCA